MAKRTMSTKIASANRNGKVDEYIAKAPEFARPIMTRLREQFHRVCPEIEEGIKWGCPHYSCEGMVGGFAAFKNYVTLGFWKSRLMKDPEKLFSRGPKASMCNIRIADMSEMPKVKTLQSYIKEAIQLNKDGVKLSPKKKSRPAIPVPTFFSKALQANAKAKATFDALSPSHRREYLEWLVEAKQESTREKRLATTLEWLADGKPRNWKYMSKAGKSK